MPGILAEQKQYGEECLDQKRLAELWKEFEIISHFPKPGVAFVNPSSVFAKGEARCEVQSYFNILYNPKDYDVVLAVAVRGVGIAQALADQYSKDLVIARKPDDGGQSKIPPGRAVRVITSSEYGENVPLEFDGSLIRAGQRVLIVDDLFATGQTVAGIAKALTAKCGAICVGVGVWTCLDYLGGEATMVNPDGEKVTLPVRALFHQKTAPVLPKDKTLQERIHCCL